MLNLFSTYSGFQIWLSFLHCSCWDHGMYQC